MKVLVVLFLLLGCFPCFAQEKPTKFDGKDAEVLEAAHHWFAVDCFNNCWNEIDKKKRTMEDNENMLLLAQSSLWHWKQRKDVKPMNLSIGYWQVSRAYSLAGNFEMGMEYGEKCRDISEKNELPPFYIGYAYEALAMAAIGQKNNKAAAGHLEEVESYLEKVKDPEEKKLLEDDCKKLQKQLD